MPCCPAPLLPSEVLEHTAAIPENGVQQCDHQIFTHASEQSRTLANSNESAPIQSDSSLAVHSPSTVSSRLISIPTLSSVPSICLQRQTTSAMQHINEGSTVVTRNAQDTTTDRWWNRKYVLLCATCGLSSIVLAFLYLIIYLVLSSYTSSLEFFQTIPTYVPAIVMMITGLMVLAFIRRKHRKSVVIKLVGFMCLGCAVVCVVVTVTTTVLHMNRLQTLRECTFYTQLHSCTCLPFTQEESFEIKLNSKINNCDVIHGPLYSCLRAMFGVSVIGILVSIFSCMLVYQLLSHERKKNYWEQLENRRRFLYRRSQLATSNSSSCGAYEEYGFVPTNSSRELYHPWRIYESAEHERYWRNNGGPQLYSPGEDSSSASRSILLTDNTPTGLASTSAPWNGAWRNSYPVSFHHLASHQTNYVDSIHNNSITTAAIDATDNSQNEESIRQSNGVLLRPMIPRGLDVNFGLRRDPPPPPPMNNRRPSSDPGVAFQLTRCLPPYSETFIPQLHYERMEAFSRLLWDPPPPYSQPTSQENIRVSSPSTNVSNTVTTNQSALQRLTSPLRRPHSLSSNRKKKASTAPNTTLSSPTAEAPNQIGSPLHYALLKNRLSYLENSGSLPICHKMRCVSFNHVNKESVDPTNFGKVECNDTNKKATKKKFSQKKFIKRINQEVKCSPGIHTEKRNEKFHLPTSKTESVICEHSYDELNNLKTRSANPDYAEMNASSHLYEKLKSGGLADENDAASEHGSDDTMIIHSSVPQDALITAENEYSEICSHQSNCSCTSRNVDSSKYEKVSQNHLEKNSTVPSTAYSLNYQKSEDSLKSVVQNTKNSHAPTLEFSDLNGNFGCRNLKNSESKFDKNTLLQTSNAKADLGSRRGLVPSLRIKDKDNNSPKKENSLKANAPTSREQSVRDHLISLKSVDV